MRRAASLVEVLIAVAILAVLIGLLIPAVQKVRLTAFGVRDKNNLRQIMLANHMFSESRNRLPGLPSTDDMSGIFTLAEILPTLDYKPEGIELGYGPYGLMRAPIPLYQSPLDPTLSDPDPHAVIMRTSGTMCSVAVNRVAFPGGIRLESSYPDGVSQTIGLSEHYYHTKLPEFTNSYMGVYIPTWYNNLLSRTGNRSSTFADPMFRDVLPVTVGTPAVTRSSRPGATFQVMPPLAESDGNLLQALQPEGLKVAMMDGSVRTLNPRVAETAFWAAVTRDAGDIATLD